VSRDAVRDALRPLRGTWQDYDALLALVGDARVVALGEASHGTDEFYRERARITQRLIDECGFGAVAVEADWPDAARVNRFVRGADEARDARDALVDFRRFPAWMWRNTAVVEFVDWLRRRNAGVPDSRRAGFYGLDLYSLHASIEAVVRYLDRVDPEAARRARERYACFDHYGGDVERYGYAAAFGAGDDCEQEVLAQLVDLREAAGRYGAHVSTLAGDDQFFAEQNARLVANAEAYYRTMFRGRVESWNLRDGHMADTLDALLAHLGGRLVVWAHNSHVGDARATELGEIGELNVGQLARERHGDAVRLVGFTTYTGTVTAASEWGAAVERKRVRPALDGSWEARFHRLGVPSFLLPVRGAVAAALAQSRLERAIGVIYRPDTERASHYFRARLSSQFDAVIHIDESHAVDPLERTAAWERGEVPETYPFAV
jgi:erythromycin esterase-like protein